MSRGKITVFKSVNENGSSTTKEILFLNSVHPSSLSKSDTYLTQNTTRLLVVQSEILVC